MRNERENRAHRQDLLRRKSVILGAVAAVALFAAASVFLGNALFGHAQAAQPLSRFIPPRQQLAMLEIQPVRLGVFHDKGDAEGHAAPIIPAKAVIYEGDDSAKVWVAANDGSLSLRDVRLGAAAGEDVEVTRGLSAGEKIVTSGTPFTDRNAGRE